MLLDEITSPNIKTKDYPTPYAFTGSSRKEETDISETLGWPLFVLIGWELPRQSFFYRSLLPSFEIDLSSVRPHFEPMSETYVTEVLSEEDIINEILEHDFIVRMPPVKEYTMWVKVKSVEKATPRIVEPEGF